MITKILNSPWLTRLLIPTQAKHAANMQESEVSAVKYMKWQDYEEDLRKEDPAYVPADVDGGYSPLFSALRSR
jgi:hypothetical protein